MKRALFTLIAITLGLGLNAQCPLTTAVDFTATDIHGTEIHLFDILDSGQYVLIDFFYYNCSACNATVPMMVQSYQAFGCNMHDVFFMEISDRDSDALCQAWTTYYGVEYPTISGTAGGAAIDNQYGISSYPTIILIAPDHSIVINDLWPINNVQSIITALESHGVTQHECNGLSITPDTLYIFNGCYIQGGELTISNSTEEDITIHSFIADSVFTYLACWYGNENVTNGMTVASGESVEITVLADAYSKDSIFNGNMYIITSSGDYQVHLILEYGGVNVNDHVQSFVNLYPNPANDFVTLSGENLGTVRVYNVLGQKMDEFDTENTELRINTTNYENGVYFIKTNETTLRFLITH